MKKLMVLLVIGLSINMTAYSQKYLKIIYANDSIYNGCLVTPPVETEFSMKCDVKGYNNKDTFKLKVFFGDGTFKESGKIAYNNLNSNLWGCAAHTYLNYGKYDVTYIISDNHGNADTLLHPGEVILSKTCKNINVNVFVDANSNCIYDNGEKLLCVLFPVYDGLSNYITYVCSNNPFSVPDSINFTLVLNENSLKKAGYILSCSASGIINFTAYQDKTFYIPVNCDTSYFDLFASTSGTLSKKASPLINIAIGGMSCNPLSGTYTLELDPRMSFVNSMTTPISVNGQTLTWIYTNIQSLILGTGGVNNMLYVNLDPSVKIGDTLCYTVKVNPITGDADTTNNVVKRCAVVRSSYDPNYIEVSPVGKSAAGFIPANTLMTYTIGFENTGNDLAENIYVLNKLDTNLDINSLKVINSSHKMDLYITDKNTLKFDFPLIQLPDSGTNKMLCNGAFTYTVKQKANLPIGRQIKNIAGIYFDNNPAVMTNETLNTIEDITTINNLKSNNNSISIMPNPANEYILIHSMNNSTVTFNVSISNLQGQIVQKTKINLLKTYTLNIKGLKDGIYLLNIYNEKINYNMKLMVYNPL